MTLQEGKKLALEIEDTALSTMRDMEHFTHTLETANKNTQDARSNLSRSNKIINRLTRRSFTNKFILTVIVVVLVASIGIIVYFRFN